MATWGLVCILALVPAVRPTPTVTGHYVEARTCDVWTGACYANAEMHITGKNAMMAWRVTEGQYQGVSLAGLSVVAVIETSETLGLAQTLPAHAVLLIDAQATPAQRAALQALAQDLGGSYVRNIRKVVAVPITLKVDCCPEKGCTVLEAGRMARLETKCLHAQEDKICGHEDSYFPPLSKGVTVTAAKVNDHTYSGPGFDKSWSDKYRRSAFVGTFTAR